MDEKTTDNLKAARLQKASDDLKKGISKAYGEYAKQFTPRPKYFRNGVTAFISGGLICMAAMWYQNYLQDLGLNKDDAGTFVTMTLVALAQFLTGIGVFDSIALKLGAGVIVPITGFANSMVAPAIEYKKEGPVLGVGGKMFGVAGPVLVCGISSAVIVGIIYWAIGKFGG